MVFDSGAEIYRALGVTPAIVASGTTTMYGGSKLRPEVADIMEKASRTMTHLDDLNVAAGRVIAEITGAEAGLVTSGAAGGLVLQAAAVMAGKDPASMARLPNADGLKNEIVMHKSHRFPYDQCYTSTGAKIVDIGDGRRCQPWELEAAINENTAAVAYLFSGFVTRRAIPLEQVVEKSPTPTTCPSIVDAASYLPPRANLRRFIDAGADMVQFSGGKAVRGPQGAGILAGRADLIEAAYANASPHQFIGRGMKVAKEEIVGLVEALRIFTNEDEDAETRRFTDMCRQVVDALIETPGLELSVKHDEWDYLTPHAVIRFTRDWRGPSRDEVNDSIAHGDPPIYMHNIFNPDELAVDPFNLDERELEIVIRRLRDVLMSG